VSVRMAQAKSLLQRSLTKSRQTASCPARSFRTSTLQMAPRPPPPPEGSESARFVYRVFIQRSPVFIASTLVVAACTGFVYNSLIDRLWRANNRGKLFHEVIPVRFAGMPPGTEPEEEEEEEEEEVAAGGEEAAASGDGEAAAAAAEEEEE